MARAYTVHYTSPGRGRHQSSRFGLLSDAEAYAETVTNLGRTDVRVEPSLLDPEIFPHCAGGLAQAIGGRCFDCGDVVTAQHAREWKADERVQRSLLIGERVRIHPASDWFMRGVTHAVVTAKRVQGETVIHYLRPDTASIATPDRLRIKLTRELILAEGE